MKTQTQIAAIDFGTSKIVTVIAQNSGMNRLDIIGSGTVPYDGYSRGEWNTPDQVSERVRDAIGAAELEAGTKIRELYVGVPGEFIRVRTCEAEIEMPEHEVTDDLIFAVQDAAADQLDLAGMGGLVMHRSPSWYAINGGKHTMTPRGKGDSLSAMMSFIIADPWFVDSVKAILGDMDITLLGFLSSTMGEMLLTLTPGERDKVPILIDVGYLNTEISVIEGDAIIYHAILPRGGGHITGDLAQGLRVPMRAAEQIKRGYVFKPDELDKDSFSEVVDDRGRRMTFKREKVSAIVEECFSDLSGMIAQTISNDIALLFEDRPQVFKASQVYLTGGGLAPMRGAREALAARINRAVKLAIAKSSKLNSPVYTSTLGLADLVFNSIEIAEAEPVSLGNRIKNLFGSRG